VGPSTLPREWLQCTESSEQGDAKSVNNVLVLYLYDKLLLLHFKSDSL